MTIPLHPTIEHLLGKSVCCWTAHYHGWLLRVIPEFENTIDVLLQQLRFSCVMNTNRSLNKWTNIRMEKVRKNDLAKPAQKKLWQRCQRDEVRLKYRHLSSPTKKATVRLSQKAPVRETRTSKSSLYTSGDRKQIVWTHHETVTKNMLNIRQGQPCQDAEGNQSKTNCEALLGICYHTDNKHKCWFFSKIPEHIKNTKSTYLNASGTIM